MKEVLVDVLVDGDIVYKTGDVVVCHRPGIYTITGFKHRLLEHDDIRYVPGGRVGDRVDTRVIMKKVFNSSNGNAGGVFESNILDISHMTTQRLEVGWLKIKAGYDKVFRYLADKGV